MLSKSDPMCVTYIRPFGENRWVEYHRTEVISNSHDPDFASKVHLAYRFEEQQPLRFEIYDVDSASPNLAEHDFLGAVSCNLGQIIGSGKVNYNDSLIIWYLCFHSHSLCIYITHHVITFCKIW